VGVALKVPGSFAHDNLGKTDDMLTTGVSNDTRNEHMMIRHNWCNGMAQPHYPCKVYLSEEMHLKGTEMKNTSRPSLPK